MVVGNGQGVDDAGEAGQLVGDVVAATRQVLDLCPGPLEHRRGFVSDPIRIGPGGLGHRDQVSSLLLVTGQTFLADLLEVRGCLLAQDPGVFLGLVEAALGPVNELCSLGPGRTQLLLGTLSCAFPDPGPGLFGGGEHRLGLGAQTLTLSLSLPHLGADPVSGAGEDLLKALAPAADMPGKVLMGLSLFDDALVSSACEDGFGRVMRPGQMRFSLGQELGHILVRSLALCGNILEGDLTDAAGLLTRGLEQLGGLGPHRRDLLVRRDPDRCGIGCCGRGQLLDARLDLGPLPLQVSLGLPRPVLVLLVPLSGEGRIVSHRRVVVSLRGRPDPFGLGVGERPGLPGDAQGLGDGHIGLGGGVGGDLAGLRGRCLEQVTGIALSALDNLGGPPETGLDLAAHPFGVIEDGLGLLTDGCCGGSCLGEFPVGCGTHLVGVPLGTLQDRGRVPSNTLTLRSHGLGHGVYRRTVLEVVT